MTNIRHLIEENITGSDVLHLAGKLGAKYEQEVYVVGGYVRDLFLGRDIKEIDFMVVGDGIKFARALANELKVDKSFVDDIHHDEKARQMIKNIIAIGKNYGMSVLAEGVETEQQVRMLNTLGCDHYQGYWFSRPLDVEGLRHFVESAAGNVAADTVCDDMPGQA